MSDSVENPVVEAPVVEVPPAPVVEVPPPAPVVEEPVSTSVPAHVFQKHVFKNSSTFYTFVYGLEGSGTIDVTDKAYGQCLSGNIITIPSRDYARDAIFGDPCLWENKLIYITDGNGNQYNYPAWYIVYIDIVNNTVTDEYDP